MTYASSQELVQTPEPTATEPLLYIGRRLRPSIVKDMFYAVLVQSGDSVATFPRRAPGISYVSPDELLQLGGSPSRNDESTTAAQIDFLLKGLAQEQPERFPLANQQIRAQIGHVLFEQSPNFMKLSITVTDKVEKDDDDNPFFVMQQERLAIRDALGLRSAKKVSRDGRPPRHYAKLGLTEQSQSFDYIECARLIKRQYPRSLRFGTVGTLKI